MHHVTGPNALQLLRRQHAHARRLLSEARRARGSEAADTRLRLIVFLRAHTSLEDEHIFAKLEGDDEVASLVEDGYREHELLAELLVELERMSSEDPQVPALLDELEEILDGHTAIEEGKLFPYIERVWPGSLIDEVGRRIAGRTTTSS